MQHRRSQGSPEDGEEGPAVPMAWFYAEYIAEELLRSGELMPPTSVEFRAGREALALTAFLADTEGELGGIRVVTQLETWLSLTAYDRQWHDWVRRRFAELAAAPDAGGPDEELARAAWRWLQETELLAPDLNAVPGGAVGGAGEEEGPQVWTPAWQLGLPLGHLAIHLF
ncbi:hypothetical protein AAH978_08890 [Streptomyces sp. ZYX-F-203]